MRTAIIVTLIAFLLGLAPSVDASCAWVLWMNAGTTDPDVPIAYATVDGYPSRWTPNEAFQTVEACNTGMGRAVADEWKARGERNKTKAKGTLWDAYIFRCLPDTVDPRGPKGSGR